MNAEIISAELRIVNETRKPYDKVYHDRNTKMYIFTEGETIFDDLMNRRNRPYDLYKELWPQIALALMDELEGSKVKESHLMKLIDSKLSWSQKLGCSCGCSPGFSFIGPDGKKISSVGGVEIFITIKFTK